MGTWKKRMRLDPMPDELGGERRIGEERRRSPGPHPEPGQPLGESSLHGFHTTGNSIRPAVVTVAS